MSSDLGTAARDRPPKNDTLFAEINIKCLNVGLVNNQLGLGNPYAYLFTLALVKDLQEVFGAQNAQGLFLTELGNQRKNALIDPFFETRASSTKKGLTVTPPQHRDIDFVDKVHNLHKYLTGACRAARLRHLEVIARAPYAYIGDPNKLGVSPPKQFHPYPGNTQR